MISKDALFRIFSEGDEKFKVKLIERYCQEKAVEYLSYKEVLAITGVRRCGKTYLMYSLIQRLIQKGVSANNIAYINFEDERLAFIEPNDLEAVYEAFVEFSRPNGKIYFFLDEIQNVPLWEKWISRMYEKVKFVISGSSSALLSSELATAITGRVIELSLYPFSFKEYISYKNPALLETRKKYSAESKAQIASFLKEYLNKGGFPEPLLFGKSDLLQEYYKAIVLRDIISRYNIKHKDYVEKISLYLLSNIGKHISLYALTAENPIGINTIKNYLNYMEKCHLLLFMKKFDYSIKKQNANPRKVYAVDTALAESVSFKFTEDKGRIIENAVFLELLRRKKSVYYHKGSYECDFLVKERLKIESALQVCLELNEEAKKREINGLIEAMKKYGLKEGSIISYEQEDTLTVEKRKIRIVPLWKWLLEY
jgi:predicted AAA+ superfamily ATPase